MKNKYMVFDSFDESDGTIDICIQKEDKFKVIIKFINTRGFDKKKVRQFILSAMDRFDKMEKLPEECQIWDMKKVAEDLKWDQST